MILILLGIVAIVSVLEFEQAKNSFIDYRSLARQSNQLGRIQANLLEARLQVKKFIANQSEENIRGTKARATKALSFIRQGEQLVRASVYLNRIGLSEELAQVLRKQDDAITEYLGYFDDVLERQAERDQVVKDKLDVVGPEMERALTSLLSHAYELEDNEATYLAGSAFRDLLLMRLHTGKYLIQNDQVSFQRAIVESENFIKALSRLEPHLEHGDFAQIVRPLREKAVLYRAAVEAVWRAIQQRNEIIVGRLDVIGPQVAGAIEDVKLQLLREQDALGPSAQEGLTRAESVIITACLVILFFGIVAVYFIGRSITVPIVNMTNALNAVAAGEKTIDIPGRARFDEIGEMAQAAQVFKEKTIEAEQLSYDLANQTTQLEKTSNELHTANTNLQNELLLKESVEKQLVHAQKLESLGTLAGGIAHDFNNMLLVILASAQSSLDRLRNGNHDVIPAIDRIETAAQRSKSIVDQILVFSRQDDPENMEALNLVDALQEAVTLIRAGVLPSIEIEVAIEEPIVLILGDITKIQQVIINLVNNACFSCGEKNGKVVMDLRSIEMTKAVAEDHYPLKAGKYAKLSVTDNGVGISEQDRAKIFDPFFTTKEVGEGTGLGLSVVHGAVVSHGGAIFCESTQGEGATFTVYLPLLDR